jgi:hypothetical protein
MRANHAVEISIDVRKEERHLHRVRVIYIPFFDECGALVAFLN